MNRPFPSSVTGFARTALPLFHKQISGGRILDDVKSIVETDRWNSFDRFHGTTQTLVDLYQKAGAVAEVTSATTGGAIGSGRWIIHEASDVRSAVIDIVRPARRRILDYSENPWHVAQWSAATPPRGISGPLVIVDTRTSLERLGPRALENRIVLTRLDLRTNMKAFASRGAGVVISDKPVAGIPGATPWAKLGWGGLPLEDAATRLVCLVLSEAEGNKLRQEAERSGQLTLHAKVDIRRYTGTHDIVSGIVRGGGNPQEEIWVLAHSAEPGAIDNASGVAACAEIARVMEALITAGRIPRPRRSIRFLNAYECYGFFHYLEHVRRLDTPLAGVCIDTIGSRPDVCDGILSWRATVPSSAGFVDRVGATLLRSSLGRVNPGYRLATGSFVSTSDTLIGDPRYGFPCPWISNHYRAGGRTWAAYHTSADVPRLLSRKGLAACVLGMAGYLYYLADAGTPELVHLAKAETRQTLSLLKKACSSQRAGVIRGLHGVTMDRLIRWTWEDSRTSVMRRLDALRRQVANAGPRVRTAGRRATTTARRIPRRTAPLSPTMENTPASIAGRIRKSGLSAWSLFWADGRRSLREIAEAISEERGAETKIEDVAAFFEAHQDLGYVRIQDPAKAFTRARLVRDLRQLGVRHSMDLVVHSSLSRVGEVRGGADTVVEALLEAVGRSGTVMGPSFNHGGAAVYNRAVTPTSNGAIPNALWRRADAIRSDHSSHAVAAIGPKAEAFCKDHAASGCWTAEGPLARLLDADGWVLSLGVSHSSTTLLHVAELSVPCGCLDVFGGRRRVLSAEGVVTEVPGLAWRERECPVPVALLEEDLGKNRAQRKGLIGDAKSTLVKARLFWSTRRGHLQDACPGCKIKPDYERARKRR